MNREQYNSDPRYAKVLEKMDLLGIMDISTTRQDKNGTIVWKLPIRNSWRNGKLIEVGSFKSGMVRNQNSAYSNYQLNKCKADVRYFKDYKTTWNDNNSDYTQEWTGKYNKYVGKQRILIPIEIDRLEYLISYCLKNYYIKHANFVANGDYIPKWRHEYDLKHISKADHYDRINDLESEVRNLESKYQASQSELEDREAESLNDCGHYDRIRDLENKLEKSNNQIKKLDDFYESSKVFNDSMYEGRNDRVKELENKLDTIQRISEYGETE